MARVCAQGFRPRPSLARRARATRDPEETTCCIRPAAGFRGRHGMTHPGSDPDPRLADYYPAWLDNLADDVTLEGSMMDGFVQGPEAVRTVLVAIRTLYDYQDFHAVGPFGEN